MQQEQLLIQLGDSASNPWLTSLAEYYQVTNNSDANALIKVSAEDDGLHVIANVAKQLLRLHIDITAFVTQQKTYPAAKQPGLNQAIGKHSKTVLDLSAGWGQDALLLTSQGYQLSMVERIPLMVVLLSEAMQRLQKSEWVSKHAIHVPEIVLANSFDYVSHQNITADCIYFDPMFPPKRKKSAATNKYMQFLHSIAGQDNDAGQVLEACLNTNAKRVVVKRPHYAMPLVDKPDIQFDSKLVHYDVYLLH